MDDIDIRITRLLMNDSRMSYRDIADAVQLTVPTVHKRVQSMIDDGIISGFTARLNVKYIGASVIHVFGKIGDSSIDTIVDFLRKERSTSMALFSSGDNVMIGAILKDVSDLDDYISVLKDRVGIKEPLIGIVSRGPIENLGRKKKEIDDYELDRLDRWILGSLKDDSRKTLSDIGVELGLSAKTVQKHLDRLVREKVVDLSIDWNPDWSSDIVSLYHIKTDDIVNKSDLMRDLSRTLDRNLVFIVAYGNLPDFALSTVWAGSMKEIEVIRKKILGIDGVISATPQIVFRGEHFDTWRDEIVRKWIKMK